MDDPSNPPSAFNLFHSDQSRVPPAPLRIHTGRDLPDLPASASRPNQCISHLESAVSTSSTDPPSQSQQDLQATTCETLLPTHLQLHQFGSRFLPHTTSPIRCILSINRDRLLLIGTDNGLSVLDMYPMEWGSDGDVGIFQKGPGEAQARVVWTGEAYVVFDSTNTCSCSELVGALFRVYQMSVLEHEDIGEGTPQGVVLALVGPDPDAPCASSGHQESIRTLRMYNLASLTNLAKWTIAQKVSTLPHRFVVLTPFGIYLGNASRGSPSRL